MKRSALIMVTLLAGAALMFAGCNNGTTDTTDTTDTTSGTTTTTKADPTTLSITAADWTWGYSATAVDGTNGLDVTLTADYGAASFGSNTGFDWSKYDTITVAIGDAKFGGDAWIQLSVQYTDNTAKATTASTSSANSTIAVEWDQTKTVKQVSVQGKSNKDTYTIKSVTLSDEK